MRRGLHELARSSHYRRSDQLTLIQRVGIVTDEHGRFRDVVLVTPDGFVQASEDVSYLERIKARGRPRKI